MAFVIADRVRETTISTGTGSVTLAGAYTSFQTFATAIGNGNNTYYTIASATSGEWEVGIGTYATTGNLLSRDTVLASSTGGAKISFSGGSKDVFVTQPSERSLLINAASNGLFAGNAAFTANGLLYANATTTAATSSALTFDGTVFSVNGGANGTRFAVKGTGAFGGFDTGAATDGRVEYAYNGTNIFYTGIDSSSLMTLMSRSGVSLAFGANGSEQMRLTSTGLGIGTSSPGAKVHAFNASGTNALILENGANGGVYARWKRPNREYYLALDINNNGGNDFSLYDATAAATRLTVDSSGNLGLGVTPSAWSGVAGVFEIKGNAYIYSTTGVMSLGANAYFNGTNWIYKTTQATTRYEQVNGQHQWSYAASGTAGNAISFTQAMTLDASGNLLVGTTSNTGAYRMRVEATGTALAVFKGAEYCQVLVTDGTRTMYQQVYDNVAKFFTSTSTPLTFGTNEVECARITSGGNFGIGQASPQTALGFANTATISWGTTNYPFISGDQPNNTLTFGTQATERARINSSGNLLVGTTANYSRLTVSNGNSARTGITISDANTASLMLFAGASADAVIAVDTNNLVFKTGATVGQDNGTERARITSGGNFVVARGTGGDTTIGSTLYADGTVTAARSSSSNGDLNLYVYSTGAAAARFYVGMGGTVYATSTTITAISDQRLKENIQDIDVGLDAIMALKPRKFDWKAGKGKDKKGDRGWIAQEFEQVFPDMVDTWADPAPEGEEPYKAVNADLIPVLVKAIQELKAEFDAYKATHP